MYVNFIQERGMSFMNDVHNNKHLTVEERIIIEKELKEPDCKLIQLSEQAVINGSNETILSELINVQNLHQFNTFNTIHLEKGLFFEFQLAVSTMSV